MGLLLNIFYDSLEVNQPGERYGKLNNLNKFLIVLTAAMKLQPNLNLLRAWKIKLCSGVSDAL